MRVLATIPHYYQPKPNPNYGSELQDAKYRAVAVRSCLASLYQTFGPKQTNLELLERRETCNRDLAGKLDIVLCTTGNNHLVANLPREIFTHHQTQADGRFLGYECHAILADNIGNYDYFCYLEDDIIVWDPTLLWKAAWFSDLVGNEALLAPHRYETSDVPPVYKFYIDTSLADMSLVPRLRNRPAYPAVRSRALGREIDFVPAENPHAGCFFLSAAQMREWVSKPYFLDRSSEFIGPLESAATLGILRTFDVYKTAVSHAGFCEVHHAIPRYLNNLIRFAPDFRLM